MTINWKLSTFLDSRTDSGQYILCNQRYFMRHRHSVYLFVGIGKICKTTPLPIYTYIRGTLCQLHLPISSWKLNTILIVVWYPVYYKIDFLTCSCIHKPMQQ